MGWLSDFFSNPVSTVSNTLSGVGNDISHAVNVLGNDVSGALSGNGKNLGELAALGGAAFFGPEMLSGLTEAGPSIGTAAGADAATSAAAGETGLASLPSSVAPAANAFGDTSALGASTAPSLGADGSFAMGNESALSGTAASPYALSSGSTGQGLTSTGFSSGGLNPTVSASAFNPSTSTPSFLSSLMNGNFGQAASTAGNWIGNHPTASIYGASSLYDMYAKNQMAKAQQANYQNTQNTINNMYAPGSAEYNALANQVAASDAASGRNSQYAARANTLAGMVAQLKMNALSGTLGNQNAMYNAGLGNQYSLFNTPASLATLYSMTGKGQ